MAITAANILAATNAALERNETDINDQIKATLFDLSSREDFLTREAIRNTVAGEYIYSMPENFKDMSIIKLDDRRPLQKITFETLQRYHANTTQTGEPGYYALKNNYLWLDIIPDGIYEMRMWYSIYHPDDITDILFADEFREAIYEGTISRVCQKFEDWQGTKMHLDLYEKHIEIRKRAMEKTLHCQKYNDL